MGQFEHVVGRIRFEKTGATAFDFGIRAVCGHCGTPMTGQQYKTQGGRESKRSRCVGRTFDVLLEKPGRYPGQLVGRSPYLQPVQLMAAPSMIGEIAAVTITEISANSLFGTLAPVGGHGQSAALAQVEG